MSNKLVGMIGAVAALAAADATIASAKTVDHARLMNPVSYSELLDGVDNAGAVLGALDRAAKPGDGVQVAQWYDDRDHHHRYRRRWDHDHHHRYWRRSEHHHHHRRYYRDEY